MYSFNVRMEGDDPARDDIVNRLIPENCSSIFFMYRNLVEFIIANAATDDARFHFLDAKLVFLTPDVANSEENRSLRFTISEAGSTYFTREVAKEKLAGISAYFEYIQAQSAKVQAVFGDTQIFKNEHAFADDLEAIRVRRAGILQENISLTDLLDWANQSLNTIYHKVPAVWTDLANNINDGGVSFPNGKTALRNFLNSANYLEPVRHLMIDFLFDEMLKKVNQSVASQRNITNRRRLQQIILNLGLQDPGELLPGSEEFNEHLQVAKTAYKTAVTQRNVTADSINNNLLYSNKDQVLAPAVRRMLLYLKGEIGGIGIQIALEQAYDEANERLLLLQNLHGLINSILEKLRYQITYDLGGGGAPVYVLGFQNLKPYILYEIDDYRSAISRMHHVIAANEADGTTNSAINSFELPLIDIRHDGFYFYNLLTGGGNGLMFNDLDDPKQLSFVDLPNPTNHVSLLAGDNHVVQRNLILAALNNRPGDFNFRRTYEAVYALPSDGSGINTQMMWRKANGLAGGIGRADPVDDDSYLWSFEGNIEYLRAQLQALLPQQDLSEFSEATVGTFLGLNIGYYKSPEYLAEHLRPVTGPNEITYNFLPYPPAAEDDVQWYVQCNSPYVYNAPQTGLSGVAPAHPNTGNNPLLYFRIKYFRRVGFGGDELVTRKVLKSTDNRRNRPHADNIPEDYKAADYLGLNLPVVMNLEANLAWFHTLKPSWGVIKNKGQYLTVNPNFRIDAGKVMGHVTNYSNILENTSSLSATVMGKALMALIEPRTAWKELKQTSMDQLPTDQEWCHLRGHGDGGQERTGNFVSGSTHCNTEQLAIESAQRITTQNSRRYVLKSTAYLIPDESMVEQAGVRPNYLSTDPNYRDRAYGTNLIGYRQITQEQATDIEARDHALTIDNAPLGQLIRYKIYYRPDESVRLAKLFDYTFEAQSEFFDRNQYNILTYSVRFLLDPVGFYREMLEYYLTLE